MALPATEIIVSGSASADVGWLNAGGTITVNGDAGDTAGHCAASGQIYIGGRAGTRSGSLMKKDPLYPAPELWILKNTGSFSFEFMGGGTAVVCGCDCQDLPSVLGDRPCVGMVGGTIYVRGPVAELPANIKSLPLDRSDISFLEAGLCRFLEKIDQKARHKELSVWKEWHKLVPQEEEETRELSLITREKIANYRHQNWIEHGLFSDVLPDAFETHPLLGRGAFRLRYPEWNNHHYTAPCEYACPCGIATQLRISLLAEGKTEEALRLVLDDTPFPATVCGSVCPNLCMSACTRYRLDFPIQVDKLGLLSKESVVERPTNVTGKRIAVIGGGPAGLASAWQLARMGHQVTVFDRNEKMGGKMETLIPKTRLNRETLHREIERIQAMGVEFVNGKNVDQDAFKAIRETYDAVIVATGAYLPRTMSFPGSERLLPAVQFLGEVYTGTRKADHGCARRIVILGCGNTGVDCGKTAFLLGAEEVTLIDCARPKAFPGELEAIKKLGARIVWPCVVKEITDEGLRTEDGRLYFADEYLLCTGERADLGFLPDTITGSGIQLMPASDASILDGVFAAGDCVQNGLIVNAIAEGNEAARAADKYLSGQQYRPSVKTRIPYEKLMTAWFAKIGRSELPSPEKEYERCVSCGTCRDCHTCETSCPEKAISRISHDDGTFSYTSDPERCIGCGVCCGLCPSGIWTLRENAPISIT